MTQIQTNYVFKLVMYSSRGATDPNNTGFGIETLF